MMTPRLIGQWVFVLAAVVPLCAQELVTERLARASALNEQGSFRAALDALTPVLDAQGIGAKEAPAGVAWNLRGLALQSLGNRNEARRSYETAIGILRALPDQQALYASALDNLGSLLAEIGQLDASRSLRMQARELFKSLDDHGGMARTSTELALVAMGRGNRKEARNDLADAFREESLVLKPKIGDIAWMYSAQCLEYEREGDPRPALAAIDHAIALWIQLYGANYYLLSAGYSIRGRVFDMLRDYQSAVNDLRHALELLTQNSESDKSVYYLTQISYAQVLRHSGLKREASQMESSARAALEGLRHQQCGGCTVSAASLR